MNGRDRMMTALSNGQPDRVPMFDWFDEAVVWGVAELLGLDVANPWQSDAATRHGEESDAVLDTLCRIIDELQIDATWSSYSTGLTPQGKDWGRDKYGREFMLSEHGIPAVMESRLKTLDDVLSFDMAALLEDSDFHVLKTMVARYGTDKCHVQSINGPFQEGWLARGGMEKFCIDIVSEPDMVHAINRLTTDFNKAVIDMARHIGADVIILDGDLSGNDYMLISMGHYREFIKPYKQELVDHAHGLGMKVVKHSDGNMWALMDELIELGFDGFHPVQPQCMTMAETKAYLDGRICVFGNVDCLDLLVFGTPEMVEEETRATIMQGAPGGGHVLCSSNSLHPGVKPENVLAMFRAARKYGDYSQIPAGPSLRRESIDLDKLAKIPKRRHQRRGGRALSSPA